jgi:hypothetical protein
MRNPLNLRVHENIDRKNEQRSGTPTVPKAEEYSPRS